MEVYSIFRLNRKWLIQPVLNVTVVSQILYTN